MLVYQRVELVEPQDSQETSFFTNGFQTTEGPIRLPSAGGAER